MKEQVAIILLAAGTSTRMRAAVQTVKYRGKPLLRHAAETALASGCRPVVVVLGASEDEVCRTLDSLEVEIVINERWADGMGSSIRTGLRALEGRLVSGVILGLADQPLITAEILMELVARHVESGKTIVASRYSGTVGVPVFFARRSFRMLAALKPSQGCKSLILANAWDAEFVECPEASADIGTPTDYASQSAR